MKEIMKDLIAPKGVLGCFIVDREGAIVDFLKKGEFDETLISVMVAEISNEIANQMKIPANFSIFVLAEKGNIFMIAKKDFLLTLLTEPDVDTEEVRLKLRRGSKSIAKLL